MKNLKKPTTPISKVLFLSKKEFYESGGCKITLVDKFKDYSDNKESFIDPITREAISYELSFRLYDKIPQKVCSVSITGVSSFVELLKAMPIGFPIVGFQMGEKQNNNKIYYECIKQTYKGKKKSDIEVAIYDYLASNYKKFWSALLKEYKSNKNLLALGKLELPMYEQRANPFIKKKEEKKDDGLLTVAEFLGLSRIQEMQKYARKFEVTGRSKQDLVDRLKAKGKLK